jgi:hypothetical protein
MVMTTEIDPKLIDVHGWEEPDTGEKPRFRPASQVPLRHVDEYAEPNEADHVD